jgi:hypothetical protein
LEQQKHKHWKLDFEGKSENNFGLRNLKLLVLWFLTQNFASYLDIENYQFFSQIPIEITGVEKQF